MIEFQLDAYLNANWDQELAKRRIDQLGGFCFWWIRRPVI
jgi:hypothetical protein